jgi:hypothetical protein
MTKKSGILLALGMVAAIISAAVAMSVNFGIGDAAESAPLVKTAQTGKKAEHKTKPIVKTRHITVRREKHAPSSGPVTVYRAAPSTGGGSATGSGSVSSSSYEHESEHEGGGEGGGGGDD